MEQIYRITTDNGAFWLNVGYLEIPGITPIYPRAKNTLLGVFVNFDQLIALNIRG